MDLPTSTRVCLSHCISDKPRHRAPCHLDYSSLPPARVQTPLRTLNLKNNLLTWWTQTINWSPHCLRWDWRQCIFYIIFKYFRLIWLLLAEFWRWILVSEEHWALLTSCDSRGMYAIHLGLHPYPRNGGQSRLEIKMESHEGVVPLSTLLALYWSHLDRSLSSG